MHSRNITAAVYYFSLFQYFFQYTVATIVLKIPNILVYLLVQNIPKFVWIISFLLIFFCQRQPDTVPPHFPWDRCFNKHTVSTSQTSQKSYLTEFNTN